MVLESDIYTQLSSEVQHIYDQVYHKFEDALNILIEALQKTESFIDYLSRSYTGSKEILEKITTAELYALLNALKKCIKDFDTYVNLIDGGMESFQILIILSAGNVDEMFLEISEDVVDLFISVQTKTEDQLNDFKEIMEILGSPSTTDENQ